MVNPIENLGEACTPYIDWMIEHWYYALGVFGLVIVWWLAKILKVIK